MRHFWFQYNRSFSDEIHEKFNLFFSNVKCLLYFAAFSKTRNRAKCSYPCTNKPPPPPPPTLEKVPYIHTSFFGPHTIQPAHKHYSTSLHTTFLKPPSSHSYKIVTSITRKMKDRNFFYQIFS